MAYTWQQLLNIAGFGGALLAACAIGRNPALGALVNHDNTERVDFAMVNHPGALKFGSVLVVIGFALQFGAAASQVF